jgi:hypothetical protein
MMQNDASSDMEDDDFLGGFNPDDESTPLNVSRGNSFLLKAASIPLSSSSQLPSSSTSRKRKLAAVEIQVPRSPVGFVEDSSVPSGDDDDEYEQKMTSEDDLPPPPRRSKSPGMPEVLSQTMALPLSSSPVSSPSKNESESKAHKTDSCFTKSGSTTKSTGQGVSSNTVPGQPKVSTAALQENLLPCRRQYRQRRRFDNAEDFDIPDEDEGHTARAGADEDELSYLPTSKAGKPRRQGLAEAKNPNHKNHKSKKDERKSKRTGKGKGSIMHGTSTAKSSTGAAHKGATASSVAKTSQLPQPKEPKIYSSRSRHTTEGDKENQPCDMSSLLSSPPDSEELAFEAVTPVTKRGHGAFSKELVFQAKKFAEIDMWSMDFEDVSISGGQSSPFR